MVTAICQVKSEMVYKDQGRMQDFSRGGGPTLKFLGF